MKHAMRISIIDYLNAAPLNMAFKEGVCSQDLELIYDFPSQCADNLASGKADAGLISSIEYQRIPNLKVASGVCIASRKKVRSVVIITKKEFKDIEFIALDRFSRSSIALCKLLFKRKCGRVPKVMTMVPELEQMLEFADAALVIGDAALRQEDHGYQSLDLAELWHGETGLPFVFAFWVMNQKGAEYGISKRCRQAAQYGQDHLVSRLPDLEKQYGMSGEEIHTYLTQNIHYQMGEQELESLNRFYTYSRELGIIPEYHPLQFC
ncbi:MAG: hypothetical protein CSA81_12025 [Acidobacteria bacterium]|nr:MAG: hypothetical protein CSA81_12025 [Acidobacteriota bacterium]